MEFSEASNLIYNNLRYDRPLHILSRGGDNILFSGGIESCCVHYDKEHLICDFCLAGSEASYKMNNQISNYSKQPLFYLKIHDHKIPIRIGKCDIANDYIDISTLSDHPSYIQSHRKVSFDCFFVSTDFDFVEEKEPEPILTRFEILDIR